MINIEHYTSTFSQKPCLSQVSVRQNLDIWGLPVTMTGNFCSLFNDVTGKSYRATRYTITPTTFHFKPTLVTVVKIAFFCLVSIPYFQKIAHNLFITKLIFKLSLLVKLGLSTSVS